MRTSVGGAAPLGSRAHRRALTSVADGTGTSSAPESLWLECTGELLDVQAADVVDICESTPGVELVQFACPRCHALHESLRFG